eukprot:CAMPEP_0181314524 /NCGR_PEP_ID=MMETSP1101-20121128/14868_1 /TAXON_ID=46948 /ORGANISM="Rhodomonas abbreviata, Strain Caron Lab Isolate" /LENGTH=140 /DNA_ID=CAMNT_0023421631 /DNA_START=9 /DNA_END=431 /DNA_ORIENTATION=-
MPPFITDKPFGLKEAFLHSLSPERLEELKLHITIRMEVQHDVNRLFDRVQALAKLSVSGSDGSVLHNRDDADVAVTLWQHALMSAKSMMLMIPPFPAWLPNSQDDAWRSDEFWDSLMDGDDSENSVGLLDTLSSTAGFAA